MSSETRIPAAALAAAWLATVFSLPVFPEAAAQTPAKAKVTVTVKNVTSDKGTIRGLLCPDPALFGQNGCVGVRTTTPAKAGTVDLVFTDVPHGIYALTVSYDEDGDGRFNILSEAMAFGNNATDLPPVFDKAALKVAGDLKTEATLFRMTQ
jgi:uncharacterized protein (DUF2141 family)